MNIGKLYIVALVAPLVYAINAHALTVDVDAKWEYWSYHYSPILFDAGTYRITPIGTADGGAFNAWNAWGANETLGCDKSGRCDRGYLNSYSFGYIGANDFVHEMATIGGSVVDGTAQAYADQWLALAIAESYVFTLTAPTSLYFYMKDGASWYYDNAGGMSLSINAVPAPPAFILMLTGLGLLSLTRRKQQPQAYPNL